MKMKMRMMDVSPVTPKKQKRYRIAFTTDQINYLEEQFKMSPYITSAQRKEVALALEIPERAIKIWYQNRRMKEKKDTTSRDYDEDAINLTSFEFPGNYQDNVLRPSANDTLPYSLPSMRDDYIANEDKKFMTINSSSNMGAGILVEDAGFKMFDEGASPISVHSSPIIKSRSSLSPTNYSKTAEFSIDLCKKYRTELIENSSKPVDRVNTELDIKPKIEQKPTNFKMMEQLEPEDLSSKRKVDIPSARHTQLPPLVPCSPRYISVVPTVTPMYTQLTSGVVWKPVNVVSSVTPSASVPVSSSQSTKPAVLESAPKKCCDCDCHEKPQVPYIQQQVPGPQYILTALRLPSPSTTKF